MRDIMSMALEIFNTGIADDDERELLEYSSFYYCSGGDPTPVIEFGSKYALYIYSDIMLYDTYSDVLDTITRSLISEEFKLINKNEVKNPEWENAVLMLWSDPSDRQFCFSLIQYDAVELFKRIYSDNHNYIQPRCICNFRYEFLGQRKKTFFEPIEKRAEYIYGHCFYDNYKCINEYEHYISHEKVLLHRRTF